MYLSTTLVLALATAGCALENRDANCGGDYGTIVTQDHKVCCPGVMKSKGGKTYCCLGGSEGGCGRITCFDDTSSCKHLADVDSDDYKSMIKEYTGSSPPDPSGDVGGNGQSNAPGASEDSGDSGDSEGSGDASSTTSAASASGASSSSSSASSVVASTTASAISSDIMTSVLSSPTAIASSGSDTSDAGVVRISMSVVAAVAIVAGLLS